ncbi:MAG: hypothetical protein RL376_1643 [Verrucomicrobiota bacterium]|jgi:hypothetical protein
MLQAGQTILLPKPGSDIAHLWVILTAPDALGNVVLVNFTTQRAHSDLTLILQPSDHRFIKHATVVHYADARLTPSSAVERAIKSGLYPQHDPCSPDLVARIRANAQLSPFTPEKVKRHLQDTKPSFE